jgi:hypothetical protein
VDKIDFQHQRIRQLLLSVAVLCTLLAGCGGGATESSSSTPAPTPGSNSVTLAWEGPTTNADNGTPLTDLASYRIYLSNTAGQYPNTAAREIPAGAPGATEQVTIGNLADGTHYFVVIARDSSGNESVYSNEISVTLP